MAKINFEYSIEELKEVTSDILIKAVKHGATSAYVEINESIANSIDILNHNIETFETSYERTLILTVYFDGKKGSIGISKIDRDIDDIIKRAINIAKHTQPDEANGIADKDVTCFEMPKNIPDLKLYNPIDLPNQVLINKAIHIEELALNLQPKTIVSDGASISFVDNNFVIANTNGLNLGYKTTSYNSSIRLIGNGYNTSGNSEMQTDYWYSGARDFYDLIDDESLASIAVSRLSRRLKAGSINSGAYSVIFESSIAKSLIASFIGAISGGNLYRRLSFLNDSLNQKVFPSWVNIQENPFIVKGLASCYFDDEGVNVYQRDIVRDGFVKGYLLSSYTARKMGMKTTGSAYSHHNILVKNNFSGKLDDLCLKMKRGLVIIETIGNGLNMVTGDYSVGASALWVEDGSVKFFVNNLTIAGNLKDIFAGIKYIGDDYQNGSILCGSMMVESVNVAN